MKSLKKVGMILLFLGFFILSFSKTSQASGDLFLKHLNFEAQVKEDGSMKVTETWNIEIEDTNTLYKTFETDYTKYSGITNVTVKDITTGKGQELREIKTLMYHVPKGSYYGMENDDGNFEIAWGVGLDDTRAVRKYQISYTIQDAIHKYSDYAELYWQFVGKDFEISADKVTGTITLPQNSTSSEEIKVWGHTEDLNGEIYPKGLNQIEFTVNHFNSGRFIEIRSLFPTQMITSAKKEENVTRLNTVIEEETKWAEEANRRRETRDFIKKAISFIINIVFIGISILFIRNAIRKIKKTKGKKKLKPTENIIYYREMPRENATPAQAIYIYKKIKSNLASTEIGKIFSATLLNLNLKKIIEFQVTKNNKNKDVVTIKIQDETLVKNLENQDEKVMAEFLLSAMKSKNSQEITVKDLQKYIQRSSSRILSLQEKIEKGTKQGLYQNQILDEKEEKVYQKELQAQLGYLFAIVFGIAMVAPIIITIGLSVLIGWIPFLIITMINFILSSITLSKINVYTQQGVNEAEKWKGLKKYMEDFSMLNEREVPEIVIWEQFLVYATAFGMADKVLKQLKIVYPDFENSINSNTYPYLYLMMNTNFSNSFTNSISSSISSAYSSASGGGGGFSGGGGGGRRPEVEEAVDNRFFNKK